MVEKELSREELIEKNEKVFGCSTCPYHMPKQFAEQVGNNCLFGDGQLYFPIDDKYCVLKEGPRKKRTFKIRIPLKAPKQGQRV